MIKPKNVENISAYSLDHENPLEAYFSHESQNPMKHIIEEIYSTELISKFQELVVSIFIENKGNLITTQEVKDLF
jgi:L-rhamnose mutarotase